MDEHVLLETSMHNRLTRRQAVLAGLTFLGGFAFGACSRSRVPEGTALIYRVRKGDTLSLLSRRSGLSIQEIVRVNRLRSNTLEVGQRLEFPGIRELGPDPLAIEEDDIARYKLISRAEWGALPIKPNHDRMKFVSRMTVHHTHEIPGMMDRNDRDIVKAIARYHRNTLRWADIGYHYLIGRDGYVYEGRPVFAQGAHARGVNNLNNLGVAVIGDFNEHLPQRVQLEALESFLEAMQAKYQIPGNKVYGHYQFVNTACPGKALKSWLNSYCRDHASA